MQIDLTGKAAIVTGAAQGIGRATARLLAGLGARVVVADIQDGRGEAVVRGIREAGGSAVYLHTDVVQTAEIRRMVDTCVAEFGRLDILVNNAHYEVRGSCTDITEADWDATFAVLLRALFSGCKYALPHMIRQGGGSIINLASVLGVNPTPNYVTYTTAKAGVVQFSRQLAVDYSPHGIRVNTILPGAIATKEDPTAADQDRRRFHSLLHPARRTGVPEDIAYAVAFLASDYAGFITGASLVVDGGFTVPFAGSLVDQALQLAAEGKGPQP